MSLTTPILTNLFRATVLHKNVIDKTGQKAIAGILVGLMKLPTDAIGVATVSFKGVHTDTEIRVLLLDGTEVTGIESCIADQSLTWPVYSIGNPNNDVRIVLISLQYGILEFLYTAQMGSQSIPIQQEIDPWFRDPV